MVECLVWLGETVVPGGGGCGCDVGCWVDGISAMGGVNGGFVLLDKFKSTPNRLTPGRIRSYPILLSITVFLLQKNSIR